MNDSPTTAESKETILFPRRKRSELRVFLHFLRYLLPYWHKALLALLINVIMVTVSVISPWLGKFLVDDAFPNKDWGLMWRIFMGVVAMDLMGRFSGTTNDILNYYVNLRVNLELKRRFFQHLQRLSMTFLQHRPIGEHMYRANADVDSVMGMITDVLPSTIRAIYEFFLILAFTAFLDWKITLFVLIYSIPYTALAHKFATMLRWMDAEARRRWQARDAAMQESFAGVVAVKTFGRKRHEVQRLMLRTIYGFRMWLTQIYTQILRGHLIHGLLPMVKDKLLYGYFILQVIRGQMTYGSVFPILSYMNRLTNPVQQVVDYLQAIRVALVPAERILETMDVAPAVEDSPDAEEMPPVRGEVFLDNVAFNYEDGRTVLQGVTFAAQPGQKIAIVGHSGSGKSTVVNLLLRLYDPVGGRVMVDGYDLRGVKLSSYQQQIGLVMQETYLFKGTIRENLLFGNLEATDKDMVDVAKMAGIYDWIQQQPKGFDQDLSEGTRISLGQKQRFGLARALVRNPRLLILDEPTSSLDSESEQQLLETLKDVGKDRTIIMVSHRLNTVVDADQILVMSNGHVIERGTNAELLALDGKYAEMFRLYFGLGDDDEVMEAA